MQEPDDGCRTPRPHQSPYAPEPVEISATELGTYIRETYRHQPDRAVNVYVDVNNLTPLEYDIGPVVTACSRYAHLPDDVFQRELPDGSGQKQWNFIADASKTSVATTSKMRKKLRKEHKPYVLSDDSDFWSLVTDPTLHGLMQNGFIQRVVVTPPKKRRNDLALRTRMTYASPEDAKDPSDPYAKINRKDYIRYLYQKDLIRHLKRATPEDKEPFGH